MMFNWSITFLSPNWLILLVSLPFVWWMSWKSLGGLGKFRKWTAIAIRTIVLLAVILSLAEVQKKQVSEKLTVVYLLDQSMSIPEDQRRMMVRYTNEEIRKHRRAKFEDRAGVIVFARDPSVEHPPYDDTITIPERIESLIENDGTNLASALKLAQATLPEDSAGRIVIISDGNENIGDAREQARRLADAGIGIDVVPIRYSARAEVAVEKVSIPPDVNKGQPFDVQVVINNMTPPSFSGPPPSAKGKLKIIRKTTDGEELRKEQTITVAPGKSVQTLRGEIVEEAAFYTYEATFTPEDKSQDFLNQNNTATTFTQMRGKGQVLLLEYTNEDEGILAGKYDALAARLRKENLNVIVKNVNNAFSSIGDLQLYDTVILGNTPRDAFSDEQIRILVQNTQQMGCGLIMLGGPQSFGAGGWGGSELEAAMPVDFQIKNAKVAPSGALVMLMHACEMANGNYWQKQIANTAIDALGDTDYCGVLDTQPIFWQWQGEADGIRKLADSRKMMKARIAKMNPQDTGDFEPSVTAAAAAFEKLPPGIGVRHMIIISDGDPAKPSQATLNRLKKQRVTITTVGIATHGVAEDSTMQQIANYAPGLKGKYHKVTNAKALPKIYQQEVRKIARPLIYENSAGIPPLRKSIDHEIMKGMGKDLPPLTGYVRTTLKNSPLVEVSLVAAQPADGGEKYNTLLASWTYGLGKVVAWTSDTGRQWANSWSESPDYDRFLSQMIRWSMRPAGDTGKFSIATETRDGVGRLIITALDENDQFKNFLTMSGNVMDPSMKSQALEVKQVAPGRYEATFATGESGNYFVIVSPGQGIAPILTGVNVPYSQEFLDREPNKAIMTDIASLQPVGSEPGKVIEPTKLEEMLQTDTFRHNLNKAVSIRDVWHWVLFFGGCLFFLDVFNRRVTIDWTWVASKFDTLKSKVMGRPAEAQQVQVLDRLRSRKAELKQRMEEQRGSTRYEPSPDAPSRPTTTPSELGGATPAAKPKTQSPAPTTKPEEEKEDYTSRLLKAKKKVWDERNDADKKK